MNSAPPLIRVYDDASDRSEVIALWRSVFGYETAHNEPSLAIDRKLAVADGLLFVATVEGCIVGTIMAGYDGHRGWLYSVAVLPEHRRCGIGTSLVGHAEEELRKRGCLKINLQMLKSNADVTPFYEAAGYQVEPRISMGKRLFT